jgi:Fe-S cluster assembly protein SufD
MYTLLQKKNVVMTIERKKADRSTIFHFRVQAKGNLEAEFRLSPGLRSALTVVLILEQWAEAKVKIFYHGHEDSVFSCQTLQRHCGSHSYSDVELRCVGEDAARIDYCGKIEVLEDIIGAKAVQRNKNLVLSEAVSIHTAPAMDVRSKDVACLHGAAIGGMDPEILIYFASRGIKEPLARALFIDGFLNRS